MSMHRIAWVLIALALAGCAVGPDYQQTVTEQPQWHSAVPHGGKVEDLSKWWAQLNDTLLSDLILGTEQGNPTLDMALARLNEARANETASTGVYYPALALGASSIRSRMAFGQQVILQTNNKVGFDASWELDLFGKNRRTAEAAQARFKASEIAWHDARISLAAEVADVYIELRQCEAGLSTAEQNQQSRATVRTLIDLKAGAGLASPMDAARAQVGEAEGDSAYRAKQGECARVLNRLTALTGIDRDTLTTRLAERTGQIPLPNVTDVSSVAAHALSQRPDVAIAEFNLASASADIGASKAAMYPSLTLLGSVASNNISQGGRNTVVPTWSFGPSLSIPLFSGGRASANVAAAQARYDYAQASYQKTVREAVRNVEDSLMRLNVANARAQRAHQAQDTYQQLFNATQARYDTGLGNRITLEDARRVWLQSQDQAAAMERERVSSWIALYKALGGGWQREAHADKLAENDTKK